MSKYKNLSHSSGVKSYNVKPDSIDVRFKDGSGYTYEASEVGKADFNKITKRAAAGKGLSTLIAQNVNVREGYSTRRRGAK